MDEKFAVLILKDGTTIYGKGFGAEKTAVGELVFNTAMQGYQEALTDPSYAGQLLIMTYPLIGNYGINERDFESGSIHAHGLIVREWCPLPKHHESMKTINKFLQDFSVPAIAGIDTRFLVRHIRNAGVLPAILHVSTTSINVKALTEKMDFDYSAINFVEKVSTKRPLCFKPENPSDKKVVLIDFGVKMGIVRELLFRGVEVCVLPFHSTKEDVESYEPDGILLSNGPGDPAILTETHKLISQLSHYPIFGICLGHQLLAHAFGGKTYKLKFGHRGANHPVFDNIKKKVVITTQNHGFAVDGKSVEKQFEITHQHLNDWTVEGMRHLSKPIFSVQYHPEAAPGPYDSKYLFDEFIKNL